MLLERWQKKRREQPRTVTMTVICPGIVPSGLLSGAGGDVRG